MKTYEELDEEVQSLIADRDAALKQIEKLSDQMRSIRMKSAAVRSQVGWKFKIVNDRLDPLDPNDVVTHNRYGLAEVYESYRGGAARWPVIASEKDEASRRRIEDILWAVDRLEWAYGGGAPEEVPELQAILAGKNR